MVSDDFAAGRWTFKYEGRTMISDESHVVAKKFKAMYRDQLKGKLEPENVNRFVAIEPDSGDYFIGDTFGESVAAARAAHPDRLSFVIRVGHAVALHIAAMSI